NTFQFHVSGRKNIIQGLFTLDLKKRHDLFFLFLSIFDLSPNQDFFFMDIELPAEIENLIFFICKKKLEKKMRKSLWDLETFTNSKKLFRMKCILPTNTDTVKEMEFYGLIRGMFKFIDRLAGLKFPADTRKKLMDIRNIVELNEKKKTEEKKKKKGNDNSNT